MAMWNPWRGCHRYSEGCRYCYIHKGDAKRGVDTNLVVRTKGFDAPLRKGKDGAYQMKPGQTVYLCFSTDFLLEDADPWRGECWDMIRRRPDLHFLFLTKRITRFMDCIPEDWGKGYENVTVGCTVEDQASADTRLPVFSRLPIRHKNIICQPLIGPVELGPYLDGVELVVVGGESDRSARPLDYAWVLSIREQCLRHGVHFEFRQCGTHFVKDGRAYTLQTKDLCSQAKKAGINC
ncbi:hypothetical protein CE91St41_27160 [Oscillospiraceae bacterium]|nr:hypothetical protein CE91St40_10380 [Oscillospiraceae bacterium]BDF75827.1 hypothetical protein CE91St41_27160 [Oscillospiraceae bacterium]